MSKDIAPAAELKSSDRSQELAKECPANAAAANCLDEVHKLRQQSPADTKHSAVDTPNTTHTSEPVQAYHLHKLEIIDDSASAPKQDTSTENTSSNTAHATKSSEPSVRNMDGINQGLEKAVVGH